MSIPGYQKVTDPEARTRFEKAWGRVLPDKPGLTLMEMIDGGPDGKIRAMYMMGENPMVSDPDLEHAGGFRRLEFLVVQDIFLHRDRRWRMSSCLRPASRRRTALSPIPNAGYSG